MDSGVRNRVVQSSIHSEGILAVSPQHGLRRRFLGLLLLLGSLGATAPAAGQNWIISGQVTNTQGQPLDMVDIDIFPMGSSNDLNLSGDFTNVAGTFSLTILDPTPAGFYDIVVKPPTGAPFFSQTVTQFLAGNTTLNPIALTSGLFLSGQVVDAMGTGLPEVNLDVFDAGGSLVVTPDDITDIAGFYSMLLLPGSYSVEFHATPATGIGPFVPVRRDNIVLNSNLVLPATILRVGYAVTGIVRNNLGAALVNADVDVTHPLTRERVLTPNDNTNAAGAFSVLVPAGDWEVQVNPPPGQQLVPFLTQLTVHPTPPANDVGVVVLPPGFLVSGTTVSMAGPPVPNVDLDFIVTATQIEVPTAEDNANPQGAFGVVVAANTYDIAFRPSFALGFAPKLLTSITVAGNTLLGPVVLQPGFVLSGTITNSGVPVQDAIVTLNQTSGGAPVYVFENQSNAAGNYAIRVVPGTYDVLFTPPLGSGLPSSSVASVSVTGNTVLDVDLATGSTPPVFGMACSPSGSNAVLLWSNGATDYDEVRVLRFGTLVATLPGSSTTFTDVGLADGTYTFSVVANRGGLDAAPTVCQVVISTGMPDTFVRGDASGDGSVNIGDAIAVLSYLFGGGTLGCLDASDVNDDGTLNISDPIFLLAFLFSGGSTPGQPYPTAGPDPTPDALSCN